MKVIIPKQEAGQENYNPNYETRRRMMKAVNRGKSKKLTMADIESYFMVQRLRHGLVTEKDIEKMGSYGIQHFDNENRFPNGTEVKLNYNNIKNRPEGDLTEEFLAWVEENKDAEFHLAREKNKNSLVCLEEDNREKEVDGEIVKCPKWLFDLYSDLLVKNEETGEWVDPWSVDETVGEYRDVTHEAEEVGKLVEEEKK